MKNCFLFLLIIVSFAFSFASGGGEYKRYYLGDINCFEQTHNLRYLGIHDSVMLKDSRGKYYKQHILNDVSIHDINNGKTINIFNDTTKREITRFYFESAYFEKYRSIEFNYGFDSIQHDKGLFQFANNTDVGKREISDRLIIECQDPRTKMISIWICDKTGGNLKKVFEYKEYRATFEIDVKNRKLRTYKQVGNKMEINEADY